MKDGVIIKQSGYYTELLVKNAAYVTGGQIDIDYPDLRPGDVAATADMTYMARKDLDGSWKKIGG